MITEWMGRCQECVRLWGLFDASRRPHEVDAAVRGVLVHLVKDHPERLPARYVGCSKCAEFERALNLGARMVTPTIREVLRQADAEHRAGHLWEWAPWIVQRRAAA